MNIAIYSRKSKFTGKGESIANQIELCRAEAQNYMNKKNIIEENTKILIYEDEGFSGKNTARPQFQQMMEAIRTNVIDCVICYKLDRISRNVGDFANTYETFEKYDVDFICVNEKYDTTTPAGRAMMGMVSVFAQMERETTAERIRDNMHMLARSGRWLGGTTPTGFESQKEEQVDFAGKTRTAYMLVPVEKEMELVKHIYKKFIQLQSTAGTARYFVQNNIRTKTGKDFTDLTIKTILRNPVYCIASHEAGAYFVAKDTDICYEENELDNKHGFMPYNRTSSKKDQQVRNEVSDWMIAVGRHDGIIQATDWVKIQHILDAKREKNKSIVRTPYKSEALLSGILVCSKCNSAMRPHLQNKRKTAEGHTPYYYVCELKERSSKKRCDMCNVNGLVLDKVILDELLKYENGDSAIHKSLGELKKRLKNKKNSEHEQQGFLQSELKAKQKQMDNLLDALSNGETQDAFAEQVRIKINQLFEQCERIKMEIDKATLNETIYTDYESQTRAVVDTLKRLKYTILTTTAVEKREILKSTVESIVWDGELAHIFLLGE